MPNCNPCNRVSIPQKCPVKLNSECVIYSGSNIACFDINTGNDLNSIISKLVDATCPVYNIENDFLNFYSLPSNFSTQGLEVFSNFGVTATASAVGPYDRLVVPVGPGSISNPLTSTGSVFRFNNVYLTTNMVEHTLKLRVESMGATNPMIGFTLGSFQLSGETGAVHRSCLLDFTNYVLSGNVGGGIPTVIRYPREGTDYALIQEYADVTRKRGAIGTGNTYVTNGDLITVKWQIDSRNFTERFVFLNETTGAYVESTINLGAGAPAATSIMGGYTHRAGFVLSDGTYTIYDYNIKYLARRNIRVMVIGDSMGRGFLIPHEYGLPYLLDKIYPNEYFDSSAGSARIHNIEKAQVKNVINLQPKYTLMFHYLGIDTQEFLPSSPNFATYMDAWTKIVNGIIGVNSIPIFIKPAYWPFPGMTQTKMNNWYDFIDQQSAIFPQALILDLRDCIFTYDASGYHYSSTDNQQIAERISNLIPKP